MVKNVFAVISFLGSLFKNLSGHFFKNFALNILTGRIFFCDFLNWDNYRGYFCPCETFLLPKYDLPNRVRFKVRPFLPSNFPRKRRFWAFQALKMHPIEVSVDYDFLNWKNPKMRQNRKKSQGFQKIQRNLMRDFIWL